jgi:hypothetical protein
VRAEGLGKLKKKIITSSGLKPATFRVERLSLAAATSVFLLRVFFFREDVGALFFRNISVSPNYTNL